MKTTAILLAITLQSAFSASVLHVAPEGSDQAVGSAAAPFQSLERARDEIRRLQSGGAAGPFTVELAPGRYPITRTVEFTAKDSGREGAPITYRGSGDGETILFGARAVPLARFQKVTDPAWLERLDPSARDHVLVLSVRNEGLEHTGPYPDRFSDQGGILELFDSQGRLPLSRWPNEGYTTMKSVLEIGDKETPGIFQYRDARPSRWLKNKTIWLKGQWRVGWEDPAIRVKKIDPEAGTITFAAGIPNGIGCKYKRPGGSGKEPWVAINLPEEIDRPGEWALDFDSGLLFVWPREGENELILTQLDGPLIEVRDAADLRFENLVFEHSLGDGIVLENVERCLVAGCTVRHVAGRGIVLHGTHSGVQSCNVRHIGRGAIYVSGGDRKALVRSENFIVNNHVHHYGQLQRQYSAGVHVGVMDNNAGGKALRDAVGIRIAHNVLHHAPRDAFFYSGNDNIYEFNEVYYCGYDTKDTGAWYSWLDWTMRGNVIRHNFVYNTIGGVNPDDGASGNLAYGNVFAGPNVGVWIASGPDNIIRHNIFVKDRGPVFAIDDRGVARGYAENPRLINRVLELNPREEPWKSAHPELATLLDNRPELPWRTQFVGNLVYSIEPAPTLNKMTAATRSLEDILEERDNVTIADDPATVRAAGRDFTWKPDPAACEKIPGFEPIPFEKIGLQIDEFRKVLPTEEQRMRAPEFSPYPEDQERAFGT